MTTENTYETTYAEIMAGRPRIVSDRFMDWADSAHSGHAIRTAINADRVGTLDTYVAFVGKPPTGYTIGADMLMRVSIRK